MEINCPVAHGDPMKNNEISYKVGLRWWFVYLYLPLLQASLFMVNSFIDLEVKPNRSRYAFWLKKAFFIKKI